MDLNDLYNEFAEIRKLINHRIQLLSISQLEKSIGKINKELHFYVDDLVAKRMQIVEEYQKENK